jgi:hypothetical protein
MNSKCIIALACLLTSLFAQVEGLGAELTKQKRAELSDEQLKSALENLRRVPADADEKTEWRTWALAQKTKWWGERLEPKTFWKGKVVWLDDVASSEARRAGRMFPPIPFGGERARSRAEADDDQRMDSGEPGKVLTLHFTEREFEFWNRFATAHLKPPVKIEEQQFHTAEGILHKRLSAIQRKFWPFTQVNRTNALPRVGFENITETERRETFPRNFEHDLFPQEAYSEEALRWSMLLHVKKQYGDLVAKGDRSTNFFLNNQNWFEMNEITRPLTAKDEEAASGWKIAYLQRLQSLHVDESYLWAYLDAWHLSPSILKPFKFSRDVVMSRLNPNVMNRLPPGPPPKSATRIKEEERVAWLEKNGIVPEPADLRDLKLAEQTTWWGKPLDAKKFWAGHVIWLDEWAESAAHRYGRMFPPIPYEDPTLPHYKEEAEHYPVGWFELEGPNIHYHRSNREVAFWDKFQKTHPQPPKKIVSEQVRFAESVLAQRKREQDPDKRFHILAKQMEESRQFELKQEVQLGFPPEAFTDDAVFWAYVLAQRDEYAKNLQRFTDPNSPFVQNQLRRMLVKASFVTEPLTPIQKRTAEEWKIEYLRRLRREHADGSYIKAYLKEWSLAAELLDK